MIRKPKRPKALWVSCYPDQAKKLRPEHQASGGIKARSQSEAIRMAVYHGIRELFITQNPICECCDLINRHVTGERYTVRQFTESIHHRRGRLGLLLFDVRYWKATCFSCHSWIHNHTAESQKLGLLSKGWNKQE